MAATEVAAQQLLVLTQALSHEGFDSVALAKQAFVDSAADIRSRPWRPLSELDTAMQACREISGDDGFGLVVATSFSMLRFGTIALVVPNAPTLRTALDDLGIFYPMAQDQTEMTYAVDGGLCTAYFSPLGLTPDARRFRAEQIMGGMVTLFRLFGLADEDLVAVHFAHERPAYVARYADVFGDVCHFNSRVCKIVIRSAILDCERIENAGTTYQTARATALVELAAVADRSSVARAVRHVIQDLGFRRADMASVASALGVNERTLRRQLAKAGVSFQSLFDDLRLLESKNLIGQGSLPLKQIAERAGFETVGNFHRAFKRLTGITPAQWRQSMIDQATGQRGHATQAASAQRAEAR